MLVISRRKGQRITIGDDIELVITEVHRSSVKLGISAPRGITVLRGEIRDSIEAANREAVDSFVQDTAVGAEPLPPDAQVRPIEVTKLLRGASLRSKKEGRSP